MIKPFFLLPFPTGGSQVSPSEEHFVTGHPSLYPDPLPVVSCCSSFSRPVPGPVSSPFRGTCLQKASLARWMSLEFVTEPGGEPHRFSRKCPLEIISLVRFLLSLPTPTPSLGWGTYALASLS